MILQTSALDSSPMSSKITHKLRVLNEVPARSGNKGMYPAEVRIPTDRDIGQ